MLVFDVKCRVLEPISLSDRSGKEVTIEPGSYVLQGVDHLIRATGGATAASGIELNFVAEGDGKTAYRVSAEKLAHFIALDEIEVKA